MQGRELDVLMAAPRSTATDHLRLEEADDRLDQCVVVGIAAAADRRLDAGFGKSLDTPELDFEAQVTRIVALARQRLRQKENGSWIV
jgi:hypothetical protein